MKLENFLPRTEEHKSFLSHFLAPLSAFIVACGIVLYILG